MVYIRDFSFNLSETQEKPAYKKPIFESQTVFCFLYKDVISRNTLKCVLIENKLSFRYSKSSFLALRYYIIL